jgi:hypothetical protein
MAPSTAFTIACASLSSFTPVDDDSVLVLLSSLRTLWNKCFKSNSTRLRFDSVKSDIDMLISGFSCASLVHWSNRNGQDSRSFDSLLLLDAGLLIDEEDEKSIDDR